MKHYYRKPKRSSRTLPVRPVLALLGLMPALLYAQSGALGTAKPALVAQVTLPAAKTALTHATPGTSADAPVQSARISVNYGKEQPQADGLSVLRVQLLLHDAQGQPLAGEQWVRLRISGVLGPAALRLPNQQGELAAVLGSMGAATVPVRPEPAQQDGAVDLLVTNGALDFDLQAPATPGEVVLQFAYQDVRKEVRYFFDPQLRSMFVVGLLQGALYFHRQQDAALIQSRFNDGFDRELMRFSNQFAHDTGYYSGRAAFYVKGTIAGNTLLTASYDSDKETRARLRAAVDPQSVYPVFGDDSVSGSQVRSMQRLYVRLDNGDNYVLYGDFGTQDGALRSSSVPLGSELVQLGQYSRTLSGLQLHSEGPLRQGEPGQPYRLGYSVSAYAARDTLRHAIEEIRGQGISGPYALANNHALQDSESVEIVVRDRNNVGHIVSVTPQQRWSDYSFEPFSGRILFKTPVASSDAYGNPISIRVRYEVDQGGDKFWVVGAQAQVAPIKEVALGINYAKDHNPFSPYELRSAAVALRPLTSLTLIGEVAQSHSLRYQNPSSAGGGGFTSVPQVGQSRQDGQHYQGRAVRLEAKYALSDGQAYVKSLRTGSGFDNGFAPAQGGRSELSLGLDKRFSGTPWSVHGWASQSSQKDRTEQYQTTRRSWRLGGSWQQGSWTVGVGVQQGREHGDSGIVGNLAGTQSPGLGPSTQDHGGFFGTGAGVLNPSSGSNASNIASGVRIDTDYRAAYINTQYRPSDQSRIYGEYMQGQGEDRSAKSHYTVRRAQAGVEHEILPKLRVYARGEHGEGLTSAFGDLSKSERYTLAALGIARDSGEVGGAWDGRLFSEFRLDQRDIARNTQHVNGLRQTWRPNEYWTVEGTAEMVRSTGATTTPRAWAVTGGVHYRDAIWRVSKQLEYRRSQGIPVQSSTGTSVTDGLQSYLSTLAVARKLDQNWTLLLKNYLLYNQHADHSGQIHYGDSWQERFQLGVAWRDSATGMMSHLLRYEFKAESDRSSKDYNRALAHIFSWHAEYHPTRRLWFNTRLAGKWTHDIVEGQRSNYSAYLAAGRIIYELNDRLDLGLLGSMLYSPQGHAKQYAAGVELGFVLRENVRLGLGYNVRGFDDRDLSADNYTRPGVFVRMDIKF